MEKTLVEKSTGEGMCQQQHGFKNWLSEGYLISSLIIVESRKFLIHWTGIELGKVAAPRALKVELKMSKKRKKDNFKISIQKDPGIGGIRFHW